MEEQGGAASRTESDCRHTKRSIRPPHVALRGASVLSGAHKRRQGADTTLGGNAYYQHEHYLQPATPPASAYPELRFH